MEQKVRTYDIAAMDAAAARRMIPLFDIKPQNAALEDQLREAFARVLASGQFIMGPEVEAFEAQLLEQTGSAYAVSVSSGTDALLLALMTLGVQPGDEVLCPSFTFFATAGCVARLGAVPVWVDSCHNCFNLEPADLRRKITPRTKGIIPVHLFGQVCEMDEIMEIAREHGLWVIEDAAQSLSARYKGQEAGTIGTIGIYSFFPTKNLGAFGDAGALVTGDAALAERARMLRTHGMQPKYYHSLVGGNFRMDALQAALLRIKLPLLPGYNARRVANAQRYTAALAQLPGAAFARQASEATRLILPEAYPHNYHIWNQYTLRVPQRDGRSRDGLWQALRQQGVGAEVYYPMPLHQQECFRNYPGQAPMAELLSQQVLSIPIYPELPSEHQDAVIAAISSYIS